MDQDEVKQIERTTKMESNIEHLTVSFEEFRRDTKDFHRTQTQAIDDMKRQWQEMGGMMKGLADLQAQVNKVDAWVQKNGQPVEEMIIERKDNRRRLKDVLWKYGGAVLWVVLTTYTVINNKTETIELQDSVYNELIQSIYEAQN